MALCLFLRHGASLQQELLKLNLYICRAAEAPSLLQPIPEKRLLLMQVGRWSLCSYNFILRKLWILWDTLSFLLCLLFLSSSPPFPRAHVYLSPTRWHEGTWGKTITQIITVGCIVFNYGFSYFSKDYLGLCLGCCLVFRAIITGKRAKWQCIKIF